MLIFALGVFTLSVFVFWDKSTLLLDVFTLVFLDVIIANPCSRCSSEMCSLGHVQAVFFFLDVFTLVFLEVFMLLVT